MKSNKAMRLRSKDRKLRNKKALRKMMEHNKSVHSALVKRKVAEKL